MDGETDEIYIEFILIFRKEIETVGEYFKTVSK